MFYKTLLGIAIMSAHTAATASFRDVPKDGAPLPFSVLQTQQQVEIRHGGYGSSAFADPNNPNRFYALTDRGPNADTAVKGEKRFLVPAYRPSVGYFSIDEKGHIILIINIKLQNPAGQAITGLPNPEGYGATGEQAVDAAGQLLTTDRFGLDPEGLVVLPDGSFYISDEYGPHIAYFNPQGREQFRISPKGLAANSGRYTLPTVLAHRRPNRGMEGLAITPDRKTLVGIMQSTLYNPSKKEAVNRTLTRIVTLNLENGETHQYLYRQNADNLSNSEIRAVDAHRFLVAERDGAFPEKGKTVQKHVYLIDLRTGSDVNGQADAPQGLLLHGKTLEAHTWEELAQAGIKPVEKTLLLDLVKAVDYPHDKFEGMFLTQDGDLAVLNDDDFAVMSDKTGKIQQKVLPKTGQTDDARLYILPLNLPVDRKQGQ